MNWFSGCAAVIVVASLGACTGSSAPASLVGKWSGTITCYSIGSPLAMTVDAAKPNEAELAQGDAGALTWTASASLDAAGIVTLTGPQPTADAAVLTGQLTGDKISGAMERQLCTAFELTRAK